jgi:ketosteroid isomerase-like protein
MRALLVLTLSAVFLASCAKPVPPPDIAKIRAEVEKITAQAAVELNSGAMDTTMSHYTDDAVSMPNNGPMLKGKAAIKANFGQMTAMGVKLSNVNFTTTDVSAGGPYVYEIGTYSMTVTIPNMPEMPDHGKYLTVYERVADGSLKIKVETWNTDVMPAMPEPPAPKKK